MKLSRGSTSDSGQMTNHLALIAGRLAAPGLGFLTWMLAARLFPTAEVGIASGVISAMMLCVQLSLFGVGAAVISLFPQHRDQPGSLVNTALSLVSAAALVSAGLFVLLASVLFSELSIVSTQPIYIALFLAITLLGAVNVLMDHVSIAVRRARQVLSRNVVFGLVATLSIATVAVVANAGDSRAVVLAWLTAGLAACSLGGVQLMRSLSHYHLRLEADLTTGIELVRVGLPNYLLTLTERAPNWILPIAVTELLSPIDNAHWYMVWMMAWAVFLVPIAIGQNLFAEVSAHPSSFGASVRRGLKMSLAMGALACLASIVLAPLLLSLIGPDYALAGVTPLRILSLAVFPLALVQSYFAVCRGTRKLTEATLTGLVSAVVGLGAAIVFGMSYGLVGVAITWLAALTLTAAWALFRLSRLAGRWASYS